MKLIKLMRKYKQITRFIFVGICNTLVSYLLFVLFIKMLGKDAYQISLFASWVISSFFSFTLQKIFVFQTKGNWLKEYVKCVISWSIGYGINAVSLGILVDYLKYNVYFGQLIAIVLTTISTFLLFKYFAFKKS